MLYLVKELKDVITFDLESNSSLISNQIGFKLISSQILQKWKFKMVFII